MHLSQAVTKEQVEAQVKKIVEQGELIVNQRTPIRVLHRWLHTYERIVYSLVLCSRASLVRPKRMLTFNATWINSHWIDVQMKTQAGM